MSNRLSSKIIEITPELMRTLPDLFQIACIMGSVQEFEDDYKFSVSISKILEVYFLCATVGSYRRKMQNILKSSMKNVAAEAIAALTAMEEVCIIRYESESENAFFEKFIDTGITCIAGSPFKENYTGNPTYLNNNASATDVDLSNMLHIRLLSPYIKGVITIPDVESHIKRCCSIFKHMADVGLTPAQIEKRRSVYLKCLKYIKYYTGIILPSDSAFRNMDDLDDAFWLDKMVKEFTGIDLNALPDYNISLSCIEVDGRLTGKSLEEDVKLKVEAAVSKVRSIREFRTVSKRMLPSNTHITLQYKSGARVLCNARLSQSHDYLILEPKGTDGAYYIFDGNLAHKDVVSVREESYIRLYHTDKNTRTVHDFLKS